VPFADHQSHGDNWLVEHTSALTRFRMLRSDRSIDRAISDLVLHATHRIPYYHKLFHDAGISSSLIRAARDLPLLPITRRDTFAALPTEICTDPSANLAKCFHHQTSGTSGQALTLYYRRAELLYRQFILARVLWTWAPAVPPYRIVELGRVLKGEREIVTRQGLLTVVKPAGQAHPRNWLDWIRSVRPHVVQGFPTTLEVLARYCHEKNLDVPRPRLVISRGETLFPEVRQLLTEVFGTRVMDLYSCQEIGNVAWQCPVDSARMHINSDACLVEVVDDEGNLLPKGESGLLVLTNLFNYTMPFIRYVIGDIGRLLPSTGERCACGSRAPGMSLVEGRADDLIFLPNGDRMSPRVAVTMLLWCRPDGSRIRGIARYQLIQESQMELTLRIIEDKNADADWKEAVTASAIRNLAGMRLRIEEVADLPFENSGKFKRVISHLERV
jgi:phenylacetate-coenzyme A ligase PaaK-like adenylate-forming protein